MKKIICSTYYCINNVNGTCIKDTIQIEEGQCYTYEDDLPEEEEEWTVEEC